MKLRWDSLSVIYRLCRQGRGRREPAVSRREPPPHSAPCCQLSRLSANFFKKQVLIIKGASQAPSTNLGRGDEGALLFELQCEIHAESPCSILLKRFNLDKVNPIIVL
ncbi:hypothetical protein RRG08_004475 [Elysia crispata]|uniref:Uncharacterized protein n=1 Tax=Elysia crispata TaxID=231223 RepID=A0AAE1ED09_9GAST|nr:hypothetical protein RRG08_004475 [Elysia crispata]